jgi:hypothetical protein
MTDGDQLVETTREWSRALDRTAIAPARDSFLRYMSDLGFTYEVIHVDDGPLTVFRYVGEDGISVFCGDWMATLTHVFKRANWPLLDPFRVSDTTVRRPGVWTGEPPPLSQ